MSICYEDVLKSEEIKHYIAMSDKYLHEAGYTEHGLRHTARVAERAGKVLRELKCDERECELAKIAGYMHDIGNVINRNEHDNTGAIITMRLLDKLGMDYMEIPVIISAIGNHDEKSGNSISNVSAALILADKSDVHRDRVRNVDFATFDIHDRVNYAVENSELFVDSDVNIITLNLSIDSHICNLIEYFELFLGRMLMCRRAANYLGCEFKMVVNGTKIL